MAEAGRLIILGAGTSYGAGLPDGDRVMPHMILYMNGPLTPLRNRTPFKIFKPLQPALLSALSEVSLGKTERFPLDAVVKTFNDEVRRDPRNLGYMMLLMKAIREYLYARSCERAKEFRSFAASLEDGDLVVTFNWDMLLEIALATLRKPFSRPMSTVGTGEGVQIFKPHGSIDDFVTKIIQVPQIGEHELIERYGHTLPTLPGEKGPVEGELVRLKTYDMPFHGRVDFDDEKGMNLEILGERPSDLEWGDTDLLPFQLERMLGDATPHLLWPGVNVLLYLHSYATIEAIIRRRTAVSRIIVSGYSFPPYDAEAIGLIGRLAAHFGHPATSIVDPAAAKLPAEVLKQTFGEVELVALPFAEFDWTS